MNTESIQKGTWADIYKQFVEETVKYKQTNLTLSDFYHWLFYNYNVPDKLNSIKQSTTHN